MSVAEAGDGVGITLAMDDDGTAKKLEERALAPFVRRSLLADGEAAASA